MAEKPSSAGQITLDQLISSTSTSVLRALQEHERQQQGALTINPRIWVGYWIDLDRSPINLPGAKQQ
ncbi:MAG: hypothetical protein ACJ76N_23015 [Thermoanaerobaculia bacterium]